MKRSIKISIEIFPQAIFSGLVLLRIFKRNINAINSYIFNPNIYLKIFLIFIIF